MEKYDFEVCMRTFLLEIEEIENLLRKKYFSWQEVSPPPRVHFHCIPENLECLTKKKKTNAADETDIFKSVN